MEVAVIMFSLLFTWSVLCSFSWGFPDVLRKGNTKGLITKLLPHTSFVPTAKKLARPVKFSIPFVSGQILNFMAEFENMPSTDPIYLFLGSSCLVQ